MPGLSSRGPARETGGEGRPARGVFVTYGWPAGRNRLGIRDTEMFETMALWFVVVQFAIGLWLTGQAIWRMAADSRARRVVFERLPVNKPRARP